MPPKDWMEQNKAVEAAKAEILAAIAATNGKLDIGIKTVKSVQRGTIGKQLIGENKNEDNYNVDASFDSLFYIDIAISPVNMEKSIVLVHTAMDNSSVSGSAHYKSPCARLVSENYVRIYPTFASGSNWTYYAEQIAWQVIEFY